jgi:hypothetical protein
MKGNAYVPFMLRRGDGSTLSLDFTAMGGTLDSRFTFTRSTNATFINSQGYVQYAAANEFLNTAWITSTTPTGWGIAFGTGTTTWNNNGTVTMNTGTSSTRPMINASSMTVAIGIPHTFGYRVVSVSGSPTVGDVIHSTVAGETYAINGVTQSSSTVVVAGDIVSCTFTPTASPVPPRMGPGVQGGMTNTSMTITQPQMNRGTTLQQYLANSSTSAGNFNTPRFDYDATTLTPRGLLIEGSATNLLNWSESFASSGGTNNNWTDTSISRTTGQTDPANGTTAIRFTASAGNATVISSAAIGTSAQRTFSIWLRRVTGTGNIQFTTDNGTTWTTQAITSSWVRYTFPATTAAQRVGIRIVTSADAIEMWGAMLEDGSSSSSYIPTGASQVQRTADTCIAASTGFSSWFTGGTSGTFYADWYGGVRGITSTVRTVLSTSDVTGRHLHLQQTAAAGNLKVADFGAANSVTTSNSITSGARTKGAFSFSGSTVNLTLNGDTVATSSSIAFSTAPTYLVLGGTSTNGSTITDATVLLNGSIRAIKYWPSVLPTATLQSLTT